MTGEVRDRDGHVSYRITGAWDTGLELLSEDGKTLLHFINIVKNNNMDCNGNGIEVYFLLYDRGSTKLWN